MKDTPASAYLGPDAPYRFVGMAGAAQRARDAGALTRALHGDYDAQHAAIMEAWVKAPDPPTGGGGVTDVIGYAEAGGRRDALAAAEAFLRACVANADAPVIDETIVGGVIAPDGTLTTLNVPSSATEPGSVPMPDWAAQIKDHAR